MGVSMGGQNSQTCRVEKEVPRGERLRKHARNDGKVGLSMSGQDVRMSDGNQAPGRQPLLRHAQNGLSLSLTKYVARNMKDIIAVVSTQTAECATHRQALRSAPALQHHGLQGG